jgi:amicyanin
MKKGLSTGSTIGIVILVIVVIVILGIIIFPSMGNNTGSFSSSSSSGSSSGGNTLSGSSSSSGGTGLPQPSSYDIQIKNFAFTPATLTIKAGDTVTWTNKDSMAHTVTSDSGSELDSSSLVQGASYSHTFNTPGEYDYHCAVHPSMTAKIIVQ